MKKKFNLVPPFLKIGAALFSGFLATVHPKVGTAQPKDGLLPPSQTPVACQPGGYILLRSISLCA